jgi:hypothetical protein
MFKRLFNHYSFADGRSVPQSIIACGAFGTWRALYRLFVSGSTDSVVHFTRSVRSNRRKPYVETISVLQFAWSIISAKARLGFS